MKCASKLRGVSAGLKRNEWAEWWPIEKLKPYQNNPRVNDQAVDAVARSIKEFGFRQPIVADKDGMIVVGHTRWKAAKVLGLDEVPVHVARELTAAQAKAYRLADNKTGEKAGWDFEKLSVELGGLKGVEIPGFTARELKDLMGPGGSTGADAFPEMELQPMEHYDYVVLFFRNAMDWLAACEKLGIKREECFTGAGRKVGLGRVVDGAAALEKLCKSK